MTAVLMGLTVMFLPRCCRSRVIAGLPLGKKAFRELNNFQSSFGIQKNLLRQLMRPPDFYSGCRLTPLSGSLTAILFASRGHVSATASSTARPGPCQNSGDYQRLIEGRRPHFLRRKGKRVAARRTGSEQAFKTECFQAVVQGPHFAS